DKAVRAFQGMLLFFVLACDTLIHYRVRMVGAPVAKTVAPRTGEVAQNV
ncbi:MAG: ABC transporter permease, partial [Pseudomonadota bacterium]|nr:ABC transporter permease [Pseudomonadota bacterium]